MGIWHEYFLFISRYRYRYRINPEKTGYGKFILFDIDIDIELLCETSSWKHLRLYMNVDIPPPQILMNIIKNVDIPPPQIDIDIGRYRRFLHISMQISTHYIRGRIISDIRGKLHISRWKPLQPDHIYDINIFEYKYSCHIPSIIVYRDIDIAIYIDTCCHLYRVY